jgi:hypothetical protein
LENNVAFVNEKISVEEKSKDSFTGFSGPFGLVKPEDLEVSYWTIDRERSAFLLYTGGGGGSHVGSPRREWYGLHWNGEIARFAADEVVSVDERGQLLTWEYPELRLPESTTISRQDWVALLKDALEAMGLSYHREWVYAVRCDIR